MCKKDFGSKTKPPKKIQNANLFVQLSPKLFILQILIANDSYLTRGVNLPKSHDLIQLHLLCQRFDFIQYLDASHDFIWGSAHQ